MTHTFALDLHGFISFKDLLLPLDVTGTCVLNTGKESFFSYL